MFCMIYLHNLQNFADDSEKFSLRSFAAISISDSLIELINSPPLVSVDCSWERVIFIGVREGVADEFYCRMFVCWCTRTAIHLRQSGIIGLLLNTGGGWSGGGTMKGRGRVVWGQSRADEFLTQDVALLQYLPCTWQILHCCTIELLQYLPSLRV